MPAYELNLIMRSLAHPALVDSVKVVTSQILKRNGIVRRIEFLGNRTLSKRIVYDDEVYPTANFFILHCDLALKTLPDITDEYSRDPNVLKKNFYLIKPAQEAVCTLEEELQTPSHRPSVQHMIHMGRKLPKFSQVWEPRTGLGFYPFRR